MQITNRTPWESPTQYIGQLPTSGKGVGVVVMDEGFDLSHPDLKGNVVGVATSQGDTLNPIPLDTALTRWGWWAAPVTLPRARSAV